MLAAGRCVGAAPSSPAPDPPGPLSGTPWAFDGAGLCFPAYFAESAPHLSQRHNYQQFLPLVNNG